MGIAASTVLLRNEVRHRLSNIVPPEQLKQLGSLADSMTAAEREIMRQIYAEAFRKGMIAATAIAAGGLVCALLGYRRGGQDVGEQRAALFEQEKRRRQSEAQAASSSSNSD